MNREEAIEAAKLIKALIGMSEVSIILDTFITTIQENSFKHDDWWWLCGNLKFGPQSGRLASSEPNLQNLPSGSTYGKLIKSCIVAPPGWLWCAADFNALEDRIGAIRSGDKNKIKEFAEGYDGHSLRAHAFFSKRIHPELAVFDGDDPNSINLIKSQYPKYRGAAKAPSFALQYGGSYYTLMQNLGLSEDDAKEIESGYHALYQGIADFSQRNIEFAQKNGYVECAFGLRLRTPVIKDWGQRSGKAPYPVTAEGRSANNAVTQSWGQLINRAAIATEKRIRESEFDHDILGSNLIHDAGYFLVKEDPATIKFLNDVLIEEMEWNDHPDIKSSEVLLGAELDIGRSWDNMITLDNKLSLQDITEALSTL